MSFKIIVTGKGGVGKTTIAALLSLAFSKLGFNVIALDADSIPNLALSLGLPPEHALNMVPLVKNEKLIEERTGARPGEGWGTLFTLTPPVEDLIEKYSVEVRPNIRLIVVGNIDSGKGGCLCPAIALARAFLLHVLSRVRGIIIVDSEAGAEVFGRGLAEKFDVNICVSEPTFRSILIARRLLELARDLNIRYNILVINKVVDEDRALRLAKMLPEDLVSDIHIVHYDPSIDRGEHYTESLKVSEQSIAYSDVESLAHKLCELIKE